MSTSTSRAESLADALFAARLKGLAGQENVEGNAFLAVTDDQLLTRLTADGVEPGATHLQHIHGLVDENGAPVDSVSPTLADDADGDGVIELAEGVPSYGPILVPLSAPPGGDVEAFPTAPNGRIEFQQAYGLNDPTTYAEGFGREQLLPLDLREIVVHGATLEAGVGEGTGGEADGTAGYKLALPVATGEIDQAVKVFTADLTGLNGSGVTGRAVLLLDGQELTVQIEADGVEPGVTHAQHIHGAFDANGVPVDSTTPVPEQDTDGDGFVEVGEGATSYGPVLVSLTDPIGSGPEGFPTAPQGEIDFRTVIDLDDPASVAEGFTTADLLPLSLREIVVHGASVDGAAGAGTPGEVDGTAGYKGILPVASGEIEFQGVIAKDENVLPPLVDGQAVAEEDIVAVDPVRLALSAGDAGARNDPAVVANAYTNSVAGATTTTQYVLDHQTNSLATLANNAGTLTTVAAVTLDGAPLDFSAHAGLDILTAEDGANTAYAVLNVDGASGLYTIDLGSGAATLVGAFDAGLGKLTGLAVQGTKGWALGTDGTSLVSFDLATPGTATTTALGGDGTRLDAIDVRPATGEVFGYDDDGDRYFTLDPASGALAAASTEASPTSTRSLDIDWNPTIDRMRTVSEADENIVYNPETGTASNAATVPLFYDEPTSSPAVVANAYTNSVAGATTTTQYVLDHQTNALATLANNAGTLTTVAAVTLDGAPLDFSADAGLDILTAEDGANTAYALLNVDGRSGLYTIDLTSGAATLIGEFDGGLGTLSGLAVQGTKGWALGTEGTSLVSFDLATPGTATTTALGGDGTRLDGIDVRPATGEVFGYDDDGDRYFTLDPATGVLTAASTEASPTSTRSLDIDWNPTIDRMRTVSEADENIVYNPETGTASNAATVPLFYAPPDATITFLDEHSQSDDALGAFLIGEDGTIGPVRTVFASTEHADALPNAEETRPGGGERMAGDSVALRTLFTPEELAASQQVGLFLVQDGATSADAGRLDSTDLAFVDRSTGEAATLGTDPGDLRLVDRTDDSEVEGSISQSLSALNADGAILAIGGIDPVSGDLRIAFDNDGDKDFADLEIGFDNGRGGDRIWRAEDIDALLGETAAA